jgi:hypothetical protein
VKDDNQKCRATSQAIQDLKVFLAAACPDGVDSPICFSNIDRVHRLVISIIMICCSSFNATLPLFCSSEGLLKNDSRYQNSAKSGHPQPSPRSNGSLYEHTWRDCIFGADYHLAFFFTSS